MPSSSSSEELSSNYFSNGPSNSSNNNNYTEKGGNYSTSTDSHGIVTSQGGSKVSIDTARTRVMIESLVPFGDVQVTALKDEAYKNFHDLFKISSSIYKTPIYNKIYDQVKDAFYDRYPNPIPGSVAAFFIGCIVTTGNFKGPAGCDPRCTGSMALPAASSKKCNKCEDISLVCDENGHIRPLNNIKNSEKAYVVVLGKNFKGFSKNQIRELEIKGVKKVSFMRFYDGKYHQQTDFMDICDLPKNNCNNDSSSLSTGVIVGIVIFVIVALIVLGFLFYGRGGNNGYNDNLAPINNRVPGYNGKMKYYKN